MSNLPAPPARSAADGTMGEGGRLRIAYVLSRFPQVSETFILREMEGLVARGHRVRVVAMVLDRSPVRQSGVEPFLATMIRPRGFREIAGAQVHWMRRAPRSYARLWRDALWGNRSSRKFLFRAAVTVPVAALAARRLESDHVDRLHAHYASHSLLCAWAIWRLTGIPYGVTCHAHDLYVDRSMLAEKLSDASVVVTISDFNRRLIAEACGPDIGSRTQVVHCGVDTDHFAPPTDSERSATAGEPFRFLVVGSLQPYKGHRHALEALARVALSEAQHGHGRIVELVLVGDGELRSELEQRAEQLGIADRTRFLGALPSVEVLEELHRSDCVVQPSVITSSGKMEGIPVALMEAMACGRPVLATGISGISELVRDGDTGVLVPPADAGALAEAMADVIAEPEAHRLMAKRGRALVEAEFDLDGQIDQLSALFLGHTPERNPS